MGQFCNPLKVIKTAAQMTVRQIPLTKKHGNNVTWTVNHGEHLYEPSEGIVGSLTSGAFHD